MITLRFDLNAVRGDRFVHYLSLGEVLMADPSDLDPGSVMRLVDEEGDTYLAVVETRAGNRVELTVDFESLIPALRVELPTNLIDAIRSYVVFSDSSSSPEEGSVPNRKPVANVA